MLAHPELSRLAIAHIDCDAFYATIEKRDRPELRDKPVIVGGMTRGVVAAACYVARLYGVRSAMPMFKALKACPDAVVIKPDMAKYQRVGRQVREIMGAYSPLVEPLSIDEAFIDLSGTRQLHHGSPARSLARLTKQLETELQVTASVGLSHNKFLAKIASDLDKPRGFAVIGREETLDFLADKPVSIIWGVGQALRKRLDRDGIRLVKDLRRVDERELSARYGAIGRRLFHLCRGEDERSVDPVSKAKSISAETTFDHDLSDLSQLRGELWPLCETVARRLKVAGLAGGSVTLKLKTGGFKLLTRSSRLADPTQLAERLYDTGSTLLAREVGTESFRLIGIGAADLQPAAAADPPSLLDPERGRQKRVQKAIDEVRQRLGANSIVKGRGFKTTKRRQRTPDE
jgi:DNA polymerase-4